jgi:hypothetical protein
MSRIPFDSKAIALLALKEPIVLEQDRLVFALKSLFAKLQSLQIDVAEGPDNSSSLTLLIGDELGAVIHFGFPIPDETLEPPLGNELMWAGAREAFKDSQAHLLVTSLGDGDSLEQRRQASWRLTMLVAAIISLYPVAGIVWTAARTVLDPKRFLKEAVDAAEANMVPVDLWFGLEWFKGKSFEHDQAIVCRTRGIGYFASRELECGPASLEPSHMGQTVQGLARYILMSGRIFNDKDTLELGQGSGSRAMISYEASSYGGLAPVMKVALK